MSVHSNKKTAATITLLDRGCEFDGKLSFEGVVRIDGVFHGEIFSHDHLIIGEGAVVDGNIQVGEVEIGGNFKGNIIAKERITIHATGKVQAKLIATEFEVHKGATFDGSVEMSTAKAIVNQPDEISIVHFNAKASSQGA